jgi:STE24 endopeptidase
MSPDPATLNDLPPAPPEVKRYQFCKRLAFVLYLLVRFSLLVTFAFAIGPDLDESIRTYNPHAESGRLLRLVMIFGIVFLTLELVSLPLDFWSGFVVEHRFGLSKQTLGKWLNGRLRRFVLSGFLSLGVVVGFYLILWSESPLWWLWAALAWLAFTVGLGRVVPRLVLPLFYRFTRLDDPALVERLARLFAGTGIRVEGIFRWHLGDETRKANAALTGLGSGRRVLLSDTLLDDFTPEEIEVVFAHEIGHHAHRHLVKSVALRFVMTALGFGLLALLGESLARAAGYGGSPALAEPVALPLLMFSLGLFHFLTGPLHLALSRHFEFQADHYAVARTGRPDAFASAFAKLARLNKIDPDPPPLAVRFFHDHPPVRERVRRAVAVGNHQPAA